nr:capsid protein [Rat picobirnavirus]
MAKRNYKNSKSNVRDKDTRETQSQAEQMDCNYGKKYNPYKSKRNDWQWYAQDPQLVKDTASFPFGNPVGNRINYGKGAGTVANSSSIPGIMAIYTSPSIGMADTAVDPINIATKDIYTWTRHENAGHTNYDAPDEMMYLIAADSAYSYLAYMKRLYGVAMTYSYTNRYFPMSAIYAMDGAFNDIISNLSDFRAYINVYAHRMQSMAIPASMSYMARHQWMYEGMYYDTMNNDKAQVFMYVPEAFYVYEEASNQDDAGVLRLQNFSTMKYASRAVTPRSAGDPEPGHTVADLIAFGDSILNPILASEDFNIMSGDILKAYGRNGIVQLTKISEDYSVIPEYQEDVLDQINNCTLMGRRISPNRSSDNTSSIHVEDNIIRQDPNKEYLISTVTQYMIDEEGLQYQSAYHDAIQAALQANRVINFQHGSINPEDVIVATRLTNTPSSVTFVNTSIEENDLAVLDSLYTKAAVGDTISLCVNTMDGIASDVAGYAKVWYYAYPNRGESSVWSLIHSEDIYTVVPSLVRVNLAATDPVDAQIQNVAQKNADDFRRSAFMSVFDRHPAITQLVTYMITDAKSQTTKASIPFNTFLNDVNYYTVIDLRNIIEMNQTALLSMFYIRR